MWPVWRTTLRPLWGGPTPLRGSGLHRWLWSSSTAATQEAARLDYECWAPHVVQGGYLVIHDVFEDPADGGLGPYQIYQTAIHSGLFVQDGCTGSLRTLRSAGVVIACEDGLVGADRQH